MKQLEKIKQLEAYELTESGYISDLDSDGYVLAHKKTGARVVLLSNDDENKVFYIGFRTPPTDSTGVAHIIEHSVLCGSQKYPVKDPFIELAKGSLNTFLNAMTYPDKTVYPVASCNDQDFANLVDVYLDAVFHPNIYNEEKIFRQEGWHYEMETPESDLKINGVVYNEMKGAFSSPDDVVEREILNALFPDNSYGVESGGDPLVIPELTYEQFLAFHGRYYHPSNSYIYLYGNCDMADKLEYIDKEYLSKYDELQIDSSIKQQMPFDKPRYITKTYPIAETEEEKEHSYLVYSIAMESNLNPDEYIAFDALDYAICSAPGAPLKKALVEAGIGKDVYSEYDNGTMQPYFSIVAKDTDPERKDEFVSIVERVLKEQAEVALDHISLLASLNSSEFRYREADFGSYPRGLMLGLQMLDSWLYDSTKPFIHIVANDTFKRLKEFIDRGYFENLIKERLINNNHKIILTVVPEKGLTTKRDNELAAKLADMKASMSDEQIAEMVKKTKELAAFQEAVDDEETLKCIPLLKREDLKREANRYIYEEKKIGDIPVLYHDIFTNGISYIRFIFDMKNVPTEYWTYVGLLRSFIGLLDTDNYTYGELFNEVNLKTGGISPTTFNYANVENSDDFMMTFEMKCKVLDENISEAVRLISEMILGTNYNNPERLRELVDETKSRVESGMIASGHALAAGEAVASFSRVEATNNAMTGIPLLRLLQEIDKNFDEMIPTVISRLDELVGMIFRKENLLVDYGGPAESYEKLCNVIPVFADGLRKENLTMIGGTVEPVMCKKGLTSAAQVQYVARCGDFTLKGLEYTGALRVLKVMMGYDYLWTNVRVKGGAYGCMCLFSHTGKSYFVSYRDPHLSRTVDVFENASEYVRNFEADERTMTQYIIGAVADMDIPMTPSRKISSSLMAYLTKMTYEKKQKYRDEVLDATAESIRALAGHIDAFMETGAYCVVGGEDKINEYKDTFDVIEPLF